MREMVNILRVDISKYLKEFNSSKIDRLEFLWRKIKELNGAFGGTNDPVDIYSKAGQETLKSIVFWLVEELFEFTNAMKNRPWARSEYLIDEWRLYDEIADAAAFFILLCIRLGLDAQKFFEIVLRKIAVNEFRIRSNY